MRKSVVRHRLTQRGEGKAQVYITLAVIAIIGFLLFKFVPVVYTTSDFKKEVEELARTAAIRAEDDKKIKERFIKIRNDYQIPEDTCKFDIERKSGTLKLTVEYHIPIVFPGYTYDWTEKKEYSESSGKFN